ncbi:unnamed protein product [Urochloa decumbens]|uniref:Protein kinase domain-containing protein n=1 Tax=Urochloa decumbens TaxID=240449 RepID=A0ABC9ARD3_9POAL
MASQLSLESTLPTNLPAEFIKEITGNFSPKLELGRSVFGTVYKVKQGVLPEGGMIAVKRLTENAPVPPGIAFETKVMNLMPLQHENIVQLLSFCNEAQRKLVQHNGKYVFVGVTERCLCYKYPPKGSLDKHLYADTMSINWQTRFEIIKGICRGLHHLHKECKGTLVHMNLTPKSIWLDDNWVPKIADFGVSRFFRQEQTQMHITNVMGHNGYIAPEYLYRGEISTMLDIYSLGMLILEITTGEKNSSSFEDRSARQFVDNVYQNWRTDEQIINKYQDKRLTNGLQIDPNDLRQVKTCIAVGLKCVELDRNERPSIVDIVSMLSGKLVSVFDKQTSSSQHGRTFQGEIDVQNL